MKSFMANLTKTIFISLNKQNINNIINRINNNIDVNKNNININTK
jgi:hypothetical protein